MDQKKKSLLNEALAQHRPSLEGVLCQRCGAVMPPIVMHGVGEILEHDESARHFLAKCRNCGVWHRFDEETKLWVSDQLAQQLATTKYDTTKKSG